MNLALTVTWIRLWGRTSTARFFFLRSYELGFEGYMN